MAKKKDEKPIEPAENIGLNANETPPEETPAAENAPIEEEAPAAEEIPAEESDAPESTDASQDENKAPAAEEIPAEESDAPESTDASQDENKAPAEDDQEAQGSELLYAIRSIAKNFKEVDYQLVVIGDKEDWFSDDILFIEHECISSNPQADVLNKLLMVLINENVCEDFIWSNDDIYFVSQTSVEDIQVLKISGLLKNESNNQTLYNANRARTIDRLLSKQLPIRNFDTHLPFFFEKGKMMEVIEAFPEMLSQGLLMSSMYFNFHVDPETETEKLDWSSDKWMLRVISSLATEDKKQTFRRLIGKKHFLNHSEAGFSKLLMSWLDKQFSEKSRFEK